MKLELEGEDSNAPGGHHQSPSFGKSLGIGNHVKWEIAIWRIFPGGNN